MEPGCGTASLSVAENQTVTVTTVSGIDPIDSGTTRELFSMGTETTRSSVGGADQAKFQINEWLPPRVVWEFDSVSTV